MLKGSTLQLKDSELETTLRKDEKHGPASRLQPSEITSKRLFVTIH